MAAGLSRWSVGVDLRRARFSISPACLPIWQTRAMKWASAKRFWFARS